MDIKLYPEMNSKIAGILRVDDDIKTNLYAAALIEQLQAENAAYKSTGLTPDQIMEIKRGQDQMDLIGATPGRYEDLQRECGRLQADRDAWKRRAEAAEKDMKYASDQRVCSDESEICTICEHNNGQDCGGCWKLDHKEEAL